MRFVVVGLCSIWSFAGCLSESATSPKPAVGTLPSTEPAESAPALPDTLREHLSPDGAASLNYLDGPRLDRVLLAARGDTTEVFSWEIGKALGVEWLSNDLGRVYVPIGGNYHYAVVYVEASSGRVSPLLDNAVAVDAEARTVATYDTDTFTLRELWTGRELASWSPAGLDLIDLWQECAPSVTLSDRAGLIRYDCGEGEIEREIEW